MSEESLRPLRLTGIQLQQRLIHVQSENNRLKRELARYKNEYHYDMIDQLKKENEQLKQRISLIEEEKQINEEPVIVGQHFVQDQPEESLHRKESAESNFFVSHQERETDLEEKKEHNLKHSGEEDWFSHSVKSRSR
ncbi:hypothetical protein [Shouchella lonarensis]|uniref:Uncharacterized protein n=1 Tax=Shouchella lonarensis TaxID=1464122 RepID=A0A1G6GLK3_9BACI|nr:hypothetical protein [Shouchella lonarensis]SDB82888.1 hypothetical protein SAMN05421737_101225 [Shouchella lonarensis]